MRLADVVTRFAPAVLAEHGDSLSNDMHHALRSWRVCRSEHGPHLDCHCPACAATRALPQACGHRACPHCQHDLGDAWLTQQRRQHLPVDSFLLTFTLPGELRSTARRHPRQVYAALMQCAWQTLAQFARRGIGVEFGATAVLHTHSRRRDLHPHVHLVVPGGGVAIATGRWRVKKRYLFNTRALADVFRAKLLARLRADGLCLPSNLPPIWIAHCAYVGDGDQALAYLARYLYRGVLSEPDILAIDRDDQVRFRYRDAKTGAHTIRRLPGVDFLRLLLMHVLPKGFRRSRNYGLLHHRRRTLLARVQLMLQVRLPPITPIKRRPIQCQRCGQPMRVRVVSLAERMARRAVIDSAAPATGHPAV
ncbi:MAG: IS91 family transposase [Pseudomarimonas sp.]